MMHRKQSVFHTLVSHLSVATWNIQGLQSNLSDKLRDRRFLAEINKHHIIGLTETHCSPDDSVKVPGYHTYMICREKSRQKAHGGIAFMIKDELQSGVILCDESAHA